jgi:hypothetical protein
MVEEYAKKQAASKTNYMPKSEHIMPVKKLRENQWEQR